MALKGTAKKLYQRSYMRTYMRKKRELEKFYSRGYMVKMNLDADGQIIYDS